MTMVAIDAFQLRPSGKGVSRVLANLTLRLLARDENEIRYMALTTGVGADLLGDQLRARVIVVPEMLESRWVHAALPWHAHHAGASLMFLHREVGPFWGPPYVLHVPEDPAARWSRVPPGAWRARGRAVLDAAVMPISLRRARALATSTQATAQSLARRFGLPRDRFRVVPLGVDPVFLRAARNTVPRRHFFHLGSEDTRDNTLAVLRAYAWMSERAAEPPPPLVIAGELGKLAAPARSLELQASPDSVRIVGRISDAELGALYAGALLCVQPSSDEGFGLQPLEAMAVGAPVIAVDTPAAREVLGSGAHLVPSSAPDVLGSAMALLLLEAASREELARAGQQRSREYTWDRTADFVHALVEESRGAGKGSSVASYKIQASHGRSTSYGVTGLGSELGKRSKNSPARSIRLTVLTSIIAPYRIPVFNALSACEGIELRVLYLAESEPHRNWRIPREEIHHDYRVLPKLFQVGRNDRWLHASRGLISELRARRPDMIIAGGWDQPTNLAAFGLRRVFGYRFAWWVESNARDARTASRIIEKLKRYLVRNSDALIVPGKASAAHLDDLGAEKRRIFVAPNSVDNDFFSRQGYAHRSGRKGPVRFLFVGRLVPTKGIDPLLEAWTALDRSNHSLAVVGNGPLRENIRCRIRDRGLKHVQLFGHLDRTELADEYAKADVFVFPSISDPWGLVLNEAMAAGLPVITTPIPGAVDDLVRDGWNGIVVPPHDTEPLAQAMLVLAHDKSKRLNMGQRSSELIRHFSPQRCAEAFAQCVHACFNSGSYASD